MNDLQRQLASLHEALRGARQLDADERAALEAVVDDIQRVLDSSTDEVPGMGSICGERASCHAIATCTGDAPSRLATVARPSPAPGR